MNKTLIYIALILMPIYIFGCTTIEESDSSKTLCEPHWYSLAENKVNTGDGRGHGPDLGSAEWRLVIEFKLGIKDDVNLPDIESYAWCRYINDHYLAQ
jgi:hypothetical protein